jgi:hypothetical protein
MKIISATIFAASAQLLPSFQFGVKGGMNFTSLTKNGSFNPSGQAGYLGGIWMRVGALGFNFQPEMYVTSKDVNITDGNSTTQAKFTSIDVPLLVGGKVGAFGFGARFYTGPLVSFAINKDQSFGTAAGNVLKLDYNDQNYAWQVGAGLDIKKVSVDIRYEAGLSKQSYGTGSTNINLFNIGLAYKLF